MANIMNLTPHPIVVVDEDNNVIRTYKSEGVIRLKATTVDAGLSVDGINVTKTEFGSPEGLPEFQAGTYIIVSQMVKSAIPNRGDLVVPAEVVRDGTGNIVGCRSFGI